MYTLKLKKPVKLLHISDVVTTWDPGISSSSARSYVNAEESEAIRQLREHISALEHQIQHERDQAFETGYRDGEDAVAADVRALMKRLPLQYSTMAGELKEQLDNELKKLQEPLLDFALGLTEKMLGRALQEDENRQAMLRRNVTEFLDKVRSQTRIIMRVNPEQIDWVLSGDIVQLMNSSVKENVRFVRDPSLSPGECVLETEDFNIDGVISAQLEHLKEQLLGSGEYDN